MRWMVLGVVAWLAGCSDDASTGPDDAGVDALLVDGGADAALDAMPDAAPVRPLAPTGLVATAGRTQVRLAWQPGSDAVGYFVHRATTSGGPYEPLSGLVGDASYLDANVVDETTYYYVVYARGANGQASPPSAEVSARPTKAIPATPTNVSALGGRGQVLLTWSAAADAVGYRVERATTAAGPFAFAGIVRGPSMTVDGVMATSHWRVVALAATAESEPSGVVAQGPDDTKPSTPWGLRARTSADAVSLAWEGDASMDAFRVSWSTTPGGPYPQSASTSNRYLVVDGLAAGTYHFVVREADGTPYSNEVAVQVGATQPPRPTDVTLVAKDGSATLTWTPVPGASHYVVRGGGGADREPPIVAEPLAPTFTGASSIYGVSAVVDGVETATTEPVRRTTTHALSVDARAGVERISLEFPTFASGTPPLTVYRARADDAPYSEVWTGTGSTWSDDTAVAGVSYRYRVKRTDAGIVTWSPEIRASRIATRPAYPRNLRVTSKGYGWWQLAWDAVPAARGYTVYVASFANSGYYRYGTTTATTLLVRDIGFDTLRVTAYSDGGESAFSDALASPPAESPPLTPSHLHAWIGEGYIELAWAWQPAQSFVVRRATTPGGPYATVLSGLGPFRDTTVEGGRTYYYVVSAIANGVASAASAELAVTAATGPPPGPSITTTRVSPSQIELEWTEVPGVLGYTIYRGTSSGAETAYAESSRATFVDPNAPDGVRFYYRIAAFTYDRVSGPLGPTTSAIASAAAQPPPTATTATHGAEETYVSWTAATGATSYRIWRNSTGIGSFVAVATVSDTSYRDPTPGSHAYAITAIGPAGTSVRSPVASGSVDARGHARPTAQVDTSTGNAWVTWTAVDTQHGYDVCWRNLTASTRACATTRRRSFAIPTWTPGDTLAVQVRAHREPATAQISTPSVEVVATTRAGAPGLPQVTGYSGHRRVGMTWAPVSGATGYRLWSASHPAEPLERQPLVQDLPYFALDNVPLGSTATFAVSAIGPDGESNPVALDLTSTVTAPLVGSAGPLAGTPQVDAVTLDVGGRRDVAWEVLVASASTAPTAVTPLVRHRGRIVIPPTSSPLLIRDPARTTLIAASAATAATPARVQAVTARSGNGEVSLAWGAVPGATSYRIYRGRDDDAPGPLVAVAEVADGPFVDRGLQNGQTYRYAIAAIGSGGEGAISTPLAAIPAHDRGLAPAAVTASTAMGTVVVTWDASLGATTYVVCRSTAPSHDFACTPADLSRRFVDASVAVGTTYRYVVASDGGAFSQAATVTLP